MIIKNKESNICYSPYSCIKKGPLLRIINYFHLAFLQPKNVDVADAFLVKPAKERIESANFFPLSI